MKVNMDIKRSLGFTRHDPPDAVDNAARRLTRYVNLQLLANGLPAAMGESDSEFADISKGLLDNHRQKTHLLKDHRCPADQRIEDFLARHFADVDLDRPLRLPGRTLVLDRHGMARELALPADGDKYESELLSSYRVHNGVLNNPRHDRRTTKGTFHVAEGGLAIADDKRRVPKAVFAGLFQHAVNPPDDVLELPFTHNQEVTARTFVSLLLRPTVVPEVPGVSPKKTMETRFFAPGSLVSNLDFVESIFGNAGDPYLPEHDAGLDVHHWTGHTGCVILAPHLGGVTKEELGLPHYDHATERQRADGMCWTEDGEFYNGGSPFKITCRTDEGVVVTLISDNYFGYCKKEVKTQLSYAANLYGNAEEEHAGGALAYPRYNLGDEFRVDSRAHNGRTFLDVVVDYQEELDVQDEGYAIDKRYPNLVYIPESAVASLLTQDISWEKNGKTHRIPLLADQTYIAPSGYKLHIEKHPAAPSWRLIGTGALGTFCHKPCTVSGGGKSEISKSLRDYMIYGPILVTDLEKDLDKVEEIFTKDYSERWQQGAPQRSVYNTRPSRALLDHRRSLGSVIKLLTPSDDYTPDFNEWLQGIPNHVYAVALIIKRFYLPEWDGDWRRYFSVDIINGEPGYELKFNDRALVGTYLRVGLLDSKQWRVFKVRQDFLAAAKVQTEDDISTSTIVPGAALVGRGAPEDTGRSYKFIINCEYRLFQRPDDAVFRGLDKQTEYDLAQRGNFLCNFEPLGREHVESVVNKVIDFDAFTPPMKGLLKEANEAGSAYVVCSSEPRIVNGKPTKNPRYLQDRPDLVDPFNKYAADRGMRLLKSIPRKQPVYTPVDSVLMGRRNNAPDKSQGIRGLAVYNPIHYQELPELFMDLIVSLTGKSPSTTGFGSEGALTKGPFNMLVYTADLNAALVGYALTRLGAFTTSAGAIGPHVTVGHDVSFLVPEVWCRLTPEERDPAYLISEGLFERVEDFEYEGRTIHASRLGYRLTYEFVRRFFGRVFDNPDKVFDDAILRPETQDLEAYADGIDYIVDAQQTVAKNYFADGSVEQACPPIQAVLNIMAHGSWNGKTEKDPEVRDLFKPESILSSDWYQKRLQTKQQRDINLWQRHIAYVDKVLAETSAAELPPSLHLSSRRQYASEELQKVSSDGYLEALRGTVGADPLGV